MIDAPQDTQDRAPLARTTYVTIRPFGGLFVRMRVVVQAPVHLDTRPSQPSVWWTEVREVAAVVLSIHGITFDGDPDLTREVPVPRGFMIPRPSIEERREAALRIFESYLKRRRGVRASKRAWSEG